MNGEPHITVFSSELHADGVKTTMAIPAGHVVYREKPRLFLQSIANRQHALTCSNCSRFIGSVGLQMKFLQKLFDRQTVAHMPPDCLGDPLEDLSGLCPCNLSCGELYCSEVCRMVHWEVKGHRFLCTGTLYHDSAEQSPLYIFKTFCVQTNEIFLLVASMIAEILAHVERTAGDTAAKVITALETYKTYVHEPWWEVATLGIKSKKEKSRLEKSLRNLVKEATQLIHAVFQLKERGLDHIFCADMIAR